MLAFLGLSQTTINWLNFAWTSGHDVVYLGAYTVLMHFGFFKKHLNNHKSLDERVADLENNSVPRP
jgi:hypothetical protein